ncbi:cation diffusion facilitator family transporter [Candidatus Protochlamydia phocaeensis]|uniref:cation diffusion facilitator family transporter n=1 Tax=Candidatus Protochlamydia phocaeensis TaxID=1414722 RepID=UPI000838714E|nr:cation diffusion facilitator family transporter [Candidatus Protochlamydia phocaeensis]
MSKFPKPVSLPTDVYVTREKRHKQIVDSAKLGIKIRLAIIIFELIGVALIQSSSLFLDAIASLMDVISTLFLVVCVKLAQRPPDQDHPFGHGRYEPLGGLLLGLLLVVIGGVMFVQQLFGTFQEGGERFIHPLAWIFPVVAMVLLEVCYRLVMRTAKKQHSPALAADAIHYRIDGLTSLFATIALVVAAYFPSWSVAIDHTGALLISVFMIIIGLFASRENFHQLMDRVPDTEFFERVKKAALQVKGVLGTEKIRIQLYGPDAHVDIDVEVNPSMSVNIAHQISQQVRASIQKAWPAVRDVTVHIEPYYAGDH